MVEAVLLVEVASEVPLRGMAAAIDAARTSLGSAGIADVEVWRVGTTQSVLRFSPRRRNPA
jgi:hypothetical protein